MQKRLPPKYTPTSATTYLNRRLPLEANARTKNLRTANQARPAGPLVHGAREPHGEGEVGYQGLSLNFRYSMGWGKSPGIIVV